MKKWLKAVIGSLCCVLVLFLAVFGGLKFKYHYDNTSCYGENVNSSPVLLVAHRGYSAVAPENTLAAFSQAGKCGKFYGAECDVQLTSDSVWVIMHDDTVERMTNGTAKVCDMTYAEISALKIDAGNGIEKYPDEKIPTFEQYLDVCKEYNLRPFIEIKMDATPEQVADLYKIINEHNFSDKCTVISFYYNSLVSLRQIDSGIEIFALSTKIEKNVVTLCKDNNFGIDFCESKEQNTIKMLNSISAQGIALAAWTIDAQSAYNRMADNGIKIITCNSPEFSN